MIFTTFKAQASRHVLAALAVGILLPGQALAQDVPSFQPAGAWQVGSTELSNVRGLSNMKLPCVVSNEYDNGFVVRFSGGGGKLLAMAVDFRQNVFKQGRKYDAMLSVGDSYAKQVSASAFTSNTLIFNLRPLNDFYQVVKNGETVEISLEGNVFEFSLGQFGVAMPALESCYAGEKTAPVKPMIDSVQQADAGSLGRAGAAPVPSVEASPATPPVATPLPEEIASKPMPKSMDDIIQGDEAAKTAQQNSLPASGKGPMKIAQVTPQVPKAQIPRGPEEGSAADRVTPEPRQVSRAVDTGPNVAPRSILPPATSAQKAVASSPVAAPQPAPAVAQWDAKAGEDMKIVLSRWAERAGYDLEWQAAQEGKVAQDIRLSGSFEDAVSQLLAENGAAMGMAAHVETGQGAPKPITKSAAAPEPRSMEPTQAAIPAFHSQWFASAGSNIQSIVDEWSSRAGVKVVWQSYMNFPVKSPVNVNGSYESAIQSLLDQYAGDSARPVAQLNIDPNTGVRTLLMDMDG